MWVYRSPIGNLYIQRQPDGSYGLLYHGTVWESCSTPEAQADDVYLHVTNCWEWDKLSGKVANVPRDLSEWEIE
ncbi:MAG: hypothetical protein LUG45_05395 [Clostridiales bacterium]|nr:hypothetical protein [Clostridiales bacterium]